MKYLIKTIVIFCIISFWNITLLNSAALKSVQTYQDKIEFEGLLECPPGSDYIINECSKAIVEDIRPFLRSGIPRIGFPQLDPFYIKELPIAFGNGSATWFNYKWKNINVTGFSNHQQGDVMVDTKKKTVQYDYIIPKLKITADYERGGFFFIFPLTGEGTIKLEFVNFRIFGTIYLQVIQELPRSEPTLSIRKVTFDTTVQDVKSDLPFYHSNLFGRYINEYINQNAKWIYEDYIKPAVKKRVEEHLIPLHSAVLTFFRASDFT